MENARAPEPAPPAVRHELPALRAAGVDPGLRVHPEDGAVPGEVRGRLLLVPAIAGLSYEVLRFTAKHQAAPLFSLLVAPGLALQRITTQEPTDDMLEVAIAALEEALREDGLLESPPGAPIGPVPGSRGPLEHVELERS